MDCLFSNLLGFYYDRVNEVMWLLCHSGDYSADAVGSIPIHGGFFVNGGNRQAIFRQTHPKL